ncbi:MAG: hypothetical protein Q4A07_03195 [Coriobacteriales bacterium]|nr:hypothetical protein [Coriobacteriales bacterium]
MNEKVLLYIRLAATRRTYEFLVPLHLSVSEATQLIARLLAERESPLYQMTDDVRLMFAEGEYAGCLVDPTACFCTLVGDARIVDGSLLALV